MKKSSLNGPIHCDPETKDCFLHLFRIFLKGILLLFFAGFLFSRASIAAEVPGKYLDVKDVNSWIHAFQQENSSLVRTHTIATSPGGNEVIIMEIGSHLRNAPAVFLGANFEGVFPLATTGALFFAKMLTDSAHYTSNIRWFIMPQPNPDASAGYFSGIRWERRVNAKPVNNDMDDQTDEDGPDDLDGNGWITLMRVEDPGGDFVVTEADPRLMVKADPGKGIRGKYKIYSEGLDNDGDGQYNEDGPGGINIGISFPHLFNFREKESGLWPGESPETFGIMSFMFDHPEIAMVYTLGASDFFMNPPRSNHQGTDISNKIKVPARLAGRLGADPEKTYTMAQVIDLYKTHVPGSSHQEISPGMIASLLGLGPAVSPLEDDMKLYNRISAEYKEYLKEKGLSSRRMDAPPDKDGSFELWAYYHLGVPSFSMNLFTIPDTDPENPKEKHKGIVEPENGSPEDSTGELKVKSDNKVRDPVEKEKALLTYLDKVLDGSGFVQWKPFIHPDLGKCEIGGFIPYVLTTPRTEEIDSLCTMKLPWLLRLTNKLPDLRFLDEKITSLGAGVYKLELFIENKGFLPYPIAMGSRNRQPAPVVISLEGENLEFLEGFRRTPLGDIGGYQVKKITWLLKSEKMAQINVKMESLPFGTREKTITVGS